MIFQFLFLSRLVYGIPQPYDCQNNSNYADDVRGAHEILKGFYASLATK